MSGPAAQMVTREDVRRALAAAGGDLRAVRQKFGLQTEELLMILAYDVTLTATGEKTLATASGVFDAIDDDKE